MCHEDQDGRGISIFVVDRQADSAPVFHAAHFVLVLENAQQAGPIQHVLGVGTSQNASSLLLESEADVNVTVIACVYRPNEGSRKKKNEVKVGEKEWVPRERSAFHPLRGLNVSNDDNFSIVRDYQLGRENV